MSAYVLVGAGDRYVYERRSPWGHWDREQAIMWRKNHIEYDHPASKPILLVKLNGSWPKVAAKRILRRRELWRKLRVKS